MNLGRAKTILIVAFAGLNLFLGYHLFWPDFGRLTTVAVTSEDLQETEVFLNENNYFLETPVERSVKVSDFLTVAPDISFQGEMLQLFIKKGAKTAEAEDAAAYQVDNMTAYVYSGGLTRIEFEPGDTLAANWNELDEQQLKDKAEQFLSEELIMPEGIAYDCMEVINAEDIAIKYFRVLEDAPIFASHMKVIVESGELTTIEIYWLDPVENDLPREMKVISATDALTSLIKLLGPSEEPLDITGIELGYFSVEYDAEKWEVPPVWRIQVDESSYYFINAFTGNVEQDTFMPEQLP